MTPRISAEAGMVGLQRLRDAWQGPVTLLLDEPAAARIREGQSAVTKALAGEQAKWCERAIDAAGVRDRVKIVYSDYRDFQAAGQFDTGALPGLGRAQPRLGDQQFGVV